MDINDNVLTRDPPAEEGEIFYLNHHCPCCDATRPEVADVHSAPYDAEMEQRFKKQYGDAWPVWPAHTVFRDG